MAAPSVDDLGRSFERYLRVAPTSETELQTVRVMHRRRSPNEGL